MSTGENEIAWDYDEHEITSFLGHIVGEVLTSKHEDLDYYLAEKILLDHRPDMETTSQR